jgi:hypothetical protein
MGRALTTGALLGGIAGAAILVVRGAVTIDLGIGRTVRSLGPVRWTLAASPEVVFDVIAAPYLGKTPRALRSKLQVWERGSDMVLAEHFTPSWRLTTATLETVRFERPSRIAFRLLRGPVPHVAESFELRPVEAGTELTWSGELGTDLWAAGRLWGKVVGAQWEQAVRRTLESVKAEAERRARPRRNP